MTLPRPAAPIARPVMKPRDRIDPKKLLLSKWTAAAPIRKEKHFLVVELVEPEVENGKIEWIEIEAVMTRRRQRMPWRELEDRGRWLRGWV